MAEIVVQVGENQRVAAITKDAAKDLALKAGVLPSVQLSAFNTKNITV